ncbi:hypothetical protein [Spiroplasma sp. DGKH1]|uniref:hypothetical protein n=1 Tax=Spiroplasma sp. DGKH1 TaxID=3050074 RepID=UPI0034C679C3
MYNIVWFWKIHRDVLAKELNNKNTKVIQINKVTINGKEQWDVTYVKKRPGVIVGQTGYLYKIIPFETVNKANGKVLKYKPKIHIKYNNKGKESLLDVSAMMSVTDSEIECNDKVHNKYNVINDKKIQQEIINKIYDVHINTLSLAPDYVNKLEIENKQLKRENKIERDFTHDFQNMYVDVLTEGINKYNIPKCITCNKDLTTPYINSNTRSIEFEQECLKCIEIKLNKSKGRSI